MGQVRAQRLVLAAQVAVLALTAGAVVHSSDSAEWSHPELYLSLIALAVISEVFPIETKTLRISGAFPALVMIMAFCGPGPAVAGAVLCVAVDIGFSRPPLYRALNNLYTYALFPLAGALVFDLLDLRPAAEHEALFVSAVVLGVFVGTNFLNFVLIVAPLAILERFDLVAKIRTVYLPVLPVEVAAGLLTATVAYGYQLIGMAAVALAGIVGFIFVYLVRVNVQATERGQQLDVRTQELAALQVGLVTTVLKTLAMRDHMTARHSAAVARYSLAVARALDLDERQQEMIHTAGLFHDVGKFIFPDSILLANRRLSDEDFEIVKKHPEQGAELVRRIQGYEDVADIIIAHHERIDGKGYPYGIGGADIPIGSRILSVADTYDVMTARDSYRVPVPRTDAIAELRRVSGSQLDAHIVEVFIDLVDRGLVEFKHGDDADFEAELHFERRVRDYAAPREAAA